MNLFMTICLVGAVVVSGQVYQKTGSYSFGYDIVDEFGNKLQRQESSDGSGVVRGTYGYVDQYGISRQVSYIADSLGYRASITSNEPGTKSHQSASVQVKVEPQPTVVHFPQSSPEPQKLSYDNRQPAQVATYNSYGALPPFPTLFNKPLDDDQYNYQ